MRIAALLAWFDEPEQLLEECVAGVSSLADVLVAYDGAYDLTPGGSASSPPEQRCAIERVAGEHGLTLDLRERLWSGEIEKRTAMMRRAAELADWMLVLNADWYVTADRAAIELELARSDAEQLEVAFYEPHIDRTERHPWLLRSMREMRVEQNHWIYSGEREDGTRVGLWGGDALYPPARTEALAAPLLIEHRSDRHRTPAQLERNRVLYERIAAYVTEHEREP